jgi:hypothetical protein
MIRRVECAACLGIGYCQASDYASEGDCPACKTTGYVWADVPVDPKVEAVRARIAEVAARRNRALASSMPPAQKALADEVMRAFARRVA